MEIIMYPKFEDVFLDDTLKGIFYPLCTVIHEGHRIHFVSANGLWTNGKFESQYNCSEYSIFKLENGKYAFEGNLELYTGFEPAKYLFPKLEQDFELNGMKYLNGKMTSDDYISHQKNSLKIEMIEGFDEEYYIQTFYEFSINKLNYKQTGNHGAFRILIDDWSSNDVKSPIVYKEGTEEMDGTLNHLDKPLLADFEDYKLIGKTVGYEFFTDGNDSLVYFNPVTECSLTINSYS